MPAFLLELAFTLGEFFLVNLSPGVLFPEGSHCGIIACLSCCSLTSCPVGDATHQSEQGGHKAKWHEYHPAGAISVHHP